MAVLACLLLLWPAVSHAAITDDLVSYWKLDETSGNALDIHASNDLTETGGTIAAVANDGAMHIGMAQTGVGTYSNSNAFEGYIGTLIVDENVWGTTGSPSEETIRLRYLKQIGAWCNELHPEE